MMCESNMRQQCITAAFFMEGLHDARSDRDTKPDYNALIKSWDKGCIELVDALVSYVPLASRLCEAAAIACDGMYPGVFDYEVSSAFGKWFGEHILEHGDEPPAAEARTWLMIHIGEFFCQCLTEEEALDVRKAITNALVLEKPVSKS